MLSHNEKPNMIINNANPTAWDMYASFYCNIKLLVWLEVHNATLAIESNFLKNISVYIGKDSRYFHSLAFFFTV